MSTRPCPNCGASVSGDSPNPRRFCGQCGTTLTPAGVSAEAAPPAEPPAAPHPPASPPPPVLYDRDLHEDVTVARELPDLSSYLGRGKAQLFKTLMDPTPAGASAPEPEQEAPRSIPTPLVPPPDAAGAPAHVVVVPLGAQGRCSVAKTQGMAQTMNDPDVEARARELRDAVLGSGPTEPAAPPLSPASPAAAKANLSKTMLMGGEPPLPSGEPATSRSDRPTKPPEDPPGSHASPLSRSVLAPQPWSPPAPHAAPEQQSPPQSQGGPPAVEVARVVSLGPGNAGPGAQPPYPSGAPGGPRPGSSPNPDLASTSPLGAHGGHGAPALRTMLGMPATELPGAGGAPPAKAPPPGNAQKTMMGVAIPGIAPLHGGVPSGTPAPPAAPLAPGSAPAAAPSGSGPVDLRSKQSTMLGVAIPGIAPSHASLEAQAPRQQGYPQQQQQAYGAPGQHAPSPYGLTPQGYPAPAPHIPSQVQNTALGMMAAPELPIVPRPKTLIDEPLPAMPFIPEKKGISALAVVGIVAGLVAVLGGGVGAFFLLRSGAPLTAVPQLDENGRESLKIGCVSCPDGTTVALGASSATVAKGAAVLPLPAPLTIGDNNLTVKLDRPGAGRDEDVKVHVPVAYRVRADLATLNAKPPAITVRVEAIVGSEVKVDDKPVALDATGRGSYAIDLSKETEGTGEAKTFERKIPFVITPKGGVAQPGQLTARTGILSLALDAPGIELFTDKTTAAVAGQTRPGGAVTIDGQNVAVDPQGRFGVRVELASIGEKPLEIVASAAPQAPRIAKVRVVRVASLEAAAKELEAQSPIAFDAFGADPAAKVGQKAVIEGDVVDVRAAGGHTVLLVDTKRGCAKAATCLVRVVHGDEDKLVRGENVRVYGRLRGSVTASGKTVPELEASLVLPLPTTKAGR